jgi:type II secretory pathway pseudopilin PulG
MRTFIALVLVTIVLGLFGAAALGVARLEGHMADAQQQLATLQYDAAKNSLTEATAYADHSRWVPFLGRDERQEIRARNAALQYWTKEYDVLVPAQAEPVAAVGDDNVELQLVVANAAYRLGQGRSKDKAATMKALEEAASGYLTVLKNNTWHTDAAYNYEYIVRLRDTISKSRPPSATRRQDPAATVPKNPGFVMAGDLPDGRTVHGDPGAPPPSTDMTQFKMHIPIRPDERQGGSDAGQGKQKIRKG